MLDTKKSTIDLCVLYREYGVDEVFSVGGSEYVANGVSGEALLDLSRRASVILGREVSYKRVGDVCGELKKVYTVIGSKGDSMVNIGKELQELPKNLYLQRLERIYKKYGITKVYSEKPGTCGYQRNAFYPEPEISYEGVGELLEYSSCMLEDSDADGYYYRRMIEGSGDCFVFYDNGRFYGVM